MATVELPAPSQRPHRRRQVRDCDRRVLERAGWRTLLEYRENHVRNIDGQLLVVEPEWIAEAECGGPTPVVIMATARSSELAWAELRAAIQAMNRRAQRTC